jgi:hypothetical protein
MKKHEKAMWFYSQIDNLIPFWDHDLQRKLEFAGDYINSMMVKDLKSSKISLGPMDKTTLKLLIFSILLEYDSIKELGTPKKRIEKETYYLDTEEIFPIEDMTLEEVEFIKHCLEKINVDIETEDNEEFILNGRQFIFLLMGIMKEYTIFLGNGKKFED